VGRWFRQSPLSGLFDPSLPISKGFGNPWHGHLGNNVFENSLITSLEALPLSQITNKRKYRYMSYWYVILRRISFVQFTPKVCYRNYTDRHAFCLWVPSVKLKPILLQCSKNSRFVRRWKGFRTHPCINSTWSRRKTWNNNWRHHNQWSVNCFTERQRRTRRKYVLTGLTEDLLAKTVNLISL